METNKPVGWQFYQDGKWWHGYDRIKDHRKNTVEVGFPVRDLYAKPVPADQPEVTVPEIIEAVANYVGSQKGGPYTPAVIKAAIMGQLEHGDAFTKLHTSPAPSHSQQSVVVDSEYKLMPEQITEEMAKAFWEEYSKSRTDDLLMRCYKAMYIVAPQHSQQSEEAGISALVEALELISVTDPNEGIAWFHEIAYKALAAHRKGEKT